jgi:hypothetical protein
MRGKSGKLLENGGARQQKVLLLGNQKEIGFVRSAITGSSESLDEPGMQMATHLNKVIPNIFARPIFKMLIRYKLGFLEQSNNVKGIEWNWNEKLNLDEAGRDFQIIICKVPMNHSEWIAVKTLREKYGPRVLCIHEIVLPLTIIQGGQESLDYYVKSLEEIIPYYIGEKYFGPIDELAKLFPLDGKNVIEFGPLDSCQTAGLIHAGAKSITCIEARPGNAIKCLIACYAFGWDNVSLIMDDFHNVNNLTNQRFDLAFAHGVYYHSEAPFIFLENLVSLSDNIFLGGYCATDALPYGDYLELDYFGEKYRAKSFHEGDNCTSGLNRFGYFFHKDDLISFFHGKGYEIVIISDDESSITAGKYLRFLARKKT